MKTGSKITYCLTAFWLLLCAASFGVLSWYKLRPGPVGKIQNFWPQNISYQYDRSSYNLVLFAHPKCGCTYASLVELQKLTIETGNKMKMKIFFYHPKGTDSTWSESESKKLAMRIPNAEVVFDEGGEVARRFGAMTSGQSMVYSPEGKLSYAGGLTESRGHIGSSLGTRSIASVVATGVPLINTQSTFGCLLFSEKEIEEYRK